MKPDDWPNPEAYGPYYQYDPKKAKALLSEAGFPKGFKAKLIYYAYGDDRILQSEMLQNYLGAIGITVEVSRLDYGVWVDQYLKGKFEDMALGFTVPAGGMELGNDLTYDLMHCKGAKNSWHICDPELDGLLEAQRQESDTAAEIGNISPEQLAKIRADMGLDRPFVQQFLLWLGRVVQGDLGKSIWTGRSVGQEILRTLPVTAELAILSISVALLVAIPIGILSAVRRNSWLDYTGRFFAIVGLSVPEFVLATVALLLLSLYVGWIPSLIYVPI